jgi:hypothetical protein
MVVHLVFATLLALPLPEGLAADQEALLATGTDGGDPRTVAPTVAPTPDIRGTTLSFPGTPASADVPKPVAASGDSVNGKGRLSSPDNRPSCRGDWIRTSDLLNPIEPGFPQLVN